jgi:hypothetical protein
VLIFQANQNIDRRPQLSYEKTSRQCRFKGKKVESDPSYISPLQIVSRSCKASTMRAELPDFYCYNIPKREKYTKIKWNIFFKDLFFSNTNSDNALLSFDNSTAMH